MSKSTLPTGFSDAARIVDNAWRSNYDRLTNTVTYSRQPAIEELWDTWQDCKDGNWRIDGALPIERETYHNAYCLIEALPLTCPSPSSIGAEPDGHLTLEWHKHPRWTFSVSVSPEGTLHYAALLGSEDPRGSCPFYGEVPETVLTLIRRVCRK
jgi:hypothetical protein